MITIEEIKSRSVQGVTKPFLCTGDDGKQYYVKGLLGCGRYGLIAEYLAGSLGVSLGLPVPTLQIVDVPAELVSLNSVEGIGELGSGPAFGSECVLFTQEYSNSIRPLIDSNLQARVLLFDWWIKNEDRKYGPNGGNPNMLWLPSRSELKVIDHHSAFDLEFHEEKFWRDHAFASSRDMLKDPLFQSTQKVAMEGALEIYTTALDSIPEEWKYTDATWTEMCDFDFQRVRDLLNLWRSDLFWNSL